MEFSSVFIHSEWTDICNYDSNNFIKRNNIDDEIGNYKINDNEFIINWEKWNGDDIFIKISNEYIHKKFYEKYIENYILSEINIYNENIIEIYIINSDLNIIYKKNNLKIIGNYIIDINGYLVLSKLDNIGTKFIKINNIYYNQDYLIKLINNKNIKKEKFKKINNNYYLKNESILETILGTVYSIINNSDLNISSKNNIIKLIKNINDDNNNNNNNNNDNYEYNIIDLNINNNKINKRLKKLINSNNFFKNYLNVVNIKNHFNENIDENIFNPITKLKINFKIEEKKNKRILTLVQWGYPPFGGGENWILNVNKILNKNNFETFLICFSDPFKNEYFTDTHLIDLKYVKIIQTKYDILNIIKLIKEINPDIINHQGVNRLELMKISNILNIPFLTGFCFWQDIINVNANNINVNMLDNNYLEKTDNFEFIINNSYTYVSSNFVNDIIFKLYNKKLDVIETISLEEEFKVDYINNNNFNERKYVTLINCHYNKGGYLIKYLCNNLDNNIPLQFIYTEHDPEISLDFVEQLIIDRNKINNINILYKSKTDIKDIYNKTRIILLPSLCDETFCRVGYESLVNKIPTLSTNNGNLKYLLNDYSIFIDTNDVKEWKNEIEKIYYDKERIINISNKDIKYTNINIIEEKIINTINNITDTKYKLLDKNIGFIVPWADQGLGIQSRDYYLSLLEMGYNPCIFSFKPYHSNDNNIYLQADSNEWNYKNIYYSNNYRENIDYNEILDFVYKYNIKKIIVIEATFLNIFNISLFLKSLDIKIYLIINIECIRLVELSYHKIFDYILTNNTNSYNIMSNIFKYKVKHLGFHLNHNYFKNINKKLKENINNIKFFCIGGLNSLSRKNIDLIIKSFYNIHEQNKYFNWELNIFIQGVEIPDIKTNYNCNKITFHINELSYKEIVEKYIDNDIFIHMGSHEGLGLGFYESIYCGTPILTMDWIPNNEIIFDNINGWLLNCDYSSNIYENSTSLTNKGIINEESLSNKIIEILNSNNTINIINNTIKNRQLLISENKYKFEKNLNDILSN